MNTTSVPINNLPISKEEALAWFVQYRSTIQNSVVENPQLFDLKWDKAFESTSKSGKEFIVVPVNDSLIRADNNQLVQVKALFSRNADQSILSEYVFILLDSSYTANPVIDDPLSFSGILLFYDFSYNFKYGKHINNGRVSTNDIRIESHEEIHSRCYWIAQYFYYYCPLGQVFTPNCYTVVYSLDCYGELWDAGGYGGNTNSGSGGSNGGSEGGGLGTGQYEANWSSPPNPTTNQNGEHLFGDELSIFDILEGSIPLDFFQDEGGTLPTGITTSRLAKLQVLFDEVLNLDQITFLIANYRHIDKCYNYWIANKTLHAEAARAALNQHVNALMTNTDYWYYIYDYYQQNSNGNMWWEATHSHLMSTFPSYAAENVDMNAFIVQHGIFKFGATATIFEAANSLDSQWPTLDLVGFQFYLDIFAEHLFPIGITLIPYGIGDLADIYQSCGTFSWGCATAIVGILVPFDELFDIFKKAPEIKAAWKAVKGYSIELKNAWKFLENCPRSTRVNPGFLQSVKSALNRSLHSINSLFNYAGVPYINTATIEHIFRGSINGGVHHISALIADPDTYKIHNRVETRNGCYRATIYKNGVEMYSGHPDGKSFFPDQWSEQEVITAIKGAYINKTPSGGNVYIGTYNGLQIRMQIVNYGTPSEYIISAFPN
ncbi:MAG: EndoU domain-containing protein [Saprospiraceae bacterium]|nr:EndoU domain-containing protein [Saprospiraceae bacterium]MBP7699822.1 EndoU domain-containing protein [Saprospiraceae bacterium]